MPDLTPIAPETALESYLQDRQNELSPNTLRSHRSRLTPFIEVWRFDKTDDGESYSPVTIKTQLDTVRVFARWLASIDAVPTDLPDKIRSPNIGEQNQRSDMLAIDRAKAIIEYFDRYEYAGMTHTLIAIMWETGCRIGGAHSLDIADCHLNPDTTDPYLEFRHRPPETTLKNGVDGERLVSISDSLATTISDYITEHRREVSDDAVRKPLFTSVHGRYHKNTLRNYVYSLTRPCVVSNECPHGRDISACDAAHDQNDACKCPSSKSPHTIRRSSITYLLREGTPVQMVSDRANVEVRVLEDHYDERTELEKLNVRREHLPNFD